MSIEALIAEEESIKAGFVAEAKAFKHIADQQLYKAAGHKTFEDYCDRRVNCGARHGWRMVRAGAIVEQMLAAPIGKLWLPSNERQAREFAKLENQDIPHAAQVVYDRATKKHGEPQITAESIHETLVHDKFIKPARKRSDAEHQAQKDRAMRRTFANLWQAFADLDIDPEEAAARYGTHIFGDAFEDALVYMLRLAELRDQ
jgi:hypothetical protein